MKPKTNRTADSSGDRPFDRCQTPPYAVEPLFPYLRAIWDNVWTIWEPCQGDGIMFTTLVKAGFNVLGTDILTGTDFLKPIKFQRPQIMITNPPYSLKYDFIDRAYEYGFAAWAMLMPLETLGSQRAQRAFKHGGMELIVLDKRVDFGMPNKGFTGSNAQFPVAWFTYGFDLGSEIVYATLDKPKKGR